MPPWTLDFVRLYRHLRHGRGVIADISRGNVAETDMSRRVIKSARNADL
jgi:hypothetical protein